MNLSIYNILGEKVYSEKILNPKSLILNPDLPQGMYFVDISTASEKTVQKINVIKNN